MKFLTHDLDASLNYLNDEAKLLRVIEWHYTFKKGRNIEFLNVESVETKCQIRISCHGCVFTMTLSLQNNLNANRRIYLFTSHSRHFSGDFSIRYGDMQMRNSSISSSNLSFVSLSATIRSNSFASASNNIELSNFLKSLGLTSISSYSPSSPSKLVVNGHS